MVNKKQFKSEQSASQYLEMRGYELLELNFRRSRFTIDIVAKKGGEIFFVTLKMLSDASHSFEMMAPSQVNQLRLAAASWIEEAEWQGGIHYSLIEVDGDNYAVVSFIENFI